MVDKPSAREAKRLQTRERLMGAAIAEFKRAGMAEADVGAIVTAAGVAHGTFFFHFPTKEHVLLELEHREEERIAKQLGRYVDSKHNLTSTLQEAVRLVVGLERRLATGRTRAFPMRQRITPSRAFLTSQRGRIHRVRKPLTASESSFAAPQ